MALWFDVSQDGRLKVQSGYESEVDGQIRLGRYKGVPSYAAIIMLQNQVAGLEGRIVALQGQIESYHDAAISVAEDRVAALEIAVAALQSSGVPRTKYKVERTRRLTRKDRVRFGWHVSPSDEKRLVIDAEEQRTILLAKGFAAQGAGLRENCRRLDQLGRGRRGKPWAGAHSVLRGVLLRNKQP